MNTNLGLYQWRRNGQPLVEGGRVFGSTSANLTIVNIVHGDAGQYDVVVTAPCGTVESFPAVVTVYCRSDINQNADVSSADIIAYLSLWFGDIANGTALADFNSVGGTTSADITAFLAAWFADLESGC
ncbi:MAG: hypothetical protein H7Y88_10725 [Phycisphaerales bacterium]|nr:hypothetical protein [Phycisphaerales bacterium]